MPYTTPSRYDPPTSQRAAPRDILRAKWEWLSLWLTRAFLERLLLTEPVGRVLRPALRRVMASRLSLLASCFDCEFYLSQFEDGHYRRLVGRDPLLHYALLGWCWGRSPSPAFDPGFYRSHNVGMKIGDPLLHHLTQPEVGRSPTNEVQAGRLGIPPWQIGRPAILVFNHPRGGGSSHFLDLYLAHHTNGSFNILLARGVRHSSALAVVGRHLFDLSAERHELVDFARRRGVARILVNHLIDRPVAMMEWVRELSTQLEVPYDVILHDYYVLCPRVDLVTGDGTYCGIAPAETCVCCVADYGAELRQFDPLTWRRDHLAFLDDAERIVVPSNDSAERLRSYVRKPISVWHPEDDACLPPERTPQLSVDEPLRVAVLGALNVSKGLRVVRALAEAVQRTGAPLSLSVLGPTSERLPPSVTVTGSYRPDQLDQMIKDAAPHVVLLPAVWPETWSFVLTNALRKGLPVVAFDIGAPAERLRGLSRGHLWPLAMSKNPQRLLAAFLELRDRWMR